MNNPDKYFEILKNFRYVCSPDFSFYEGMPLATRIWQVYRSRSLGWWLHVNGFEVIPSVGWNGQDSFNWCFDGLPVGGTVAVSTTGCCFADGWQCFTDGYRAMIGRISPTQALVIGHDLPEPLRGLVPVVCLPDFGHDLRRRVSGRGDGLPVAAGEQGATLLSGSGGQTAADGQGGCG